MSLMKNNIRRFQKRTVGPHHLRPGDGAWPITKLTSKTSPNILRRCWNTANKTLQSLRNFGGTLLNKTIQSQRSSWSTTLRLQLTNKFEQVFLLMWMQLLISWMIYEQKKHNLNHA